MKTRDILLIAGAVALVSFATRRRTGARPYTIDVPAPTPISRAEYERLTRQARGAQAVDVAKKIADFLAKLKKQRQGAEPKGQPWYGEFRKVGTLKNFV